MRKEAQLQSVNAPRRCTVRSWARIVSALLDVVLFAKQLEGIFEVDLLRRCYNGEDVLRHEAQKGVPVPDAFMVQTYLDEEHGQDAVLTYVKGNGCVDHNLSPKGPLLGVDHYG